MIHQPAPTQQPDQETAQRTFQVRLGHATVLVEGLTEQQAIRRARRQLCRDMPRMWDVIQGLDAGQFDVWELS